MFIGLAILVLAILAIVTPILAISTFVKCRSLERQLGALWSKVDQIEASLPNGDEVPRETGEKPRGAEGAVAPPAEDPAALPQVPTLSTEVGKACVPPVLGHPRPGGDRGIGETDPSGSDAGTAKPKPPVSKPARNLEETVTSRWMIWLGGIALVFGGAFLVKYAIDVGLLTPAVRTTLGFLLGSALAVFGEWLRRRPPQRAISAIRPDYVPAALTGAGIAIAFASVFAAHGLHGLISVPVAFGLLAGIALGAVALSLLQGPFVALLGLVGAFTVPFLVDSPRPNAWVLFPYLTVVVSAGLAVARYKGWWLLAWLMLMGAGGWTLIWFGSSWSSRDVDVIGLYLPVLAGLFFLACRGYPAGPPLRTPAAAFPVNMSNPDSVAWGASFAVAALSFLFAHGAGYDVIALASVFALCALYLGAGRWRASLDGISLIALALALAVAGSWRFPPEISQIRPWVELGGMPSWTGHEPLLAPELAPFAIASLVFAALFAVGGFVALWKAPRPGLWGAVSGFPPIGLLIIAYWRMERFQGNFSWSVVAFMTAAVMLGAAAHVGRYRSARAVDGALASYAIAVLAATSLALTMALEEAWLTVALALQIPVLAWVHQKLTLGALRHAALVVAVVVLIRLVFNHNVLDYTIGRIPGLNWLLYGYGLPAMAFYAAARVFRRERDDFLVQVLETGALVFFVLLVTLEIRHFVGDGPIGHGRYGLLEQSLQSIAWLLIAHGLLVADHMRHRFAAHWGWRVLLGLAALQVAVLQVLAGNPLSTGEPVGRWPVFNLMLPAYGAPALLALWLARTAKRFDMPRLALAAGVAALCLFFVQLNLEVRHAFHGTNLAIGRATDAEWYTYSAAWLVYGGILLAVGVWRGHALLRYASLVLVWLAVGKVFVFDMGTLAGFYRALSFLGLGAVLIAVGFFYQRFVFKPPMLRPSE